jgi:microcystin degradation protein MlrC
MQSMIQAASDAQSTTVPIIEAAAPAGGLLMREASASLLAEFSERLQEQATNVDALILILSGCIFDEDGNSVDEALIRSAREALTDARPIVVIWSNLANLSQALVDQTDLSLSYDLRNPERAAQVGRKAIDLVQRDSLRENRFRREFRALPLLLPPGAWRTDQDPIRAIDVLAREFEAEEGVCDISILTGFPFSDQAASGLSLVVTAEADRDLAPSLATRLRTAMWTNRDAFFAEPTNIETAVHEAMQSTARPVVLSDAGDDPALGAPSEGTGMLWALIDLGAQNAALAAIVDPEAVSTAIDTGVGSILAFDLGGKSDRTAGYPIEVSARVRRILGASDGGYGRAVQLDVEGRHGGSIDVIVTEQPVEPTPALFGALGIDLATKQIVGVKSAWRVHETFGLTAARLIETTTPGITTPVLAFFDFQRVPRPIYPLDPL